MDSDFDTTRAFHTPGERLRLAQAVRDGELSGELHWIEWKGRAAGGKALGATVAKHVIGFANRLPAVAERDAEGWGYLLVGVEAGAVQGMPPIDNAQLEDVVAPYLGHGGPGWMPDRVALDGSEILLIAVPPPRDGDPEYYAHKEYQGAPAETQVSLQEGRTYVRRQGKTVPASADERATLGQRAERIGELSLTVRPVAPVTWQPVEMCGVDIRSIVERKREAFLAPLQRSQLAGDSEWTFNPYRERREPDEYLAEVDDYLAEFASNYPLEIARRAMRLRGARLEVVVRNETPHNFEDVAIELALPTGVVAMWEFEENGLSLLPEPPLTWGDNPFSQIMSRLDAAIPPATLDSGEIERRGDGLLVRYPGEHLRPESAHHLDSLLIAADATVAGSTVELSWTATARNRDGRIGGSFPVEVGAIAISANQLMASEGASAP